MVRWQRSDVQAWGKSTLVTAEETTPQILIVKPGSRASRCHGEMDRRRAGKRLRAVPPGPKYGLFIKTR